MNLRHRQNTGIQRIFIAGDNRLPALSNLNRHHHRVGAEMRLRRMRTFALDGQFKFIRRCHHRPRYDTHRARWRTGPVMHAKHGLHRTLLEQPLIHHPFSAACAFFCGLENHIHRPIKILVMRKIVRSTEQHRRVTIVAACMHFSFVPRLVLEAVHFLNGKCIHVSAQTNGPIAGAVFDDAHHARHAHAANNRYAPARQLFSDQIGSLEFLVRQLRVCVNSAADLLEFVLEP